MATNQKVSSSSASTTTKSQNHATSTKQKPYSQGRPNGNTRPTSGNGQSRNAKRARWAKKSKPVAKPVVRRENTYEYISACCTLPARKPRAGEKEMQKNAETGKFKEQPKGLGHWRCSGCGKAAKVSPRKPQPVQKFTPELIAAHTVQEVPNASV